MFDWYSAGEDVDRLIAKAKYGKASKLLRGMLAVNPHDTHVRKKLAEVLALDGRRQQATEILEGMVEEFADDGFLTKAIAVVKKIQRIDPDRGDLDDKLAALTHRRESTRAQYGTVRIIQSAPAAVPEIPERPEISAKFEAVLQSPLFADATASELRAFIQGLQLLTYEAGEIVISEGEPGSSLLVVASGRVRVYVRNDVGHQVQVRVLEPGDFFGEISILTGQARTATVTAAEPCELLELGSVTLKEIGRQHPRVSQVVREVCERRARSPEELQARQELEIPL